MTITRNFKLYLNAGTASAPYINVNQYDEGEEWVFTLYNEDGSTYTPSTGAIIGIKSDGNAIMNSGSVVSGKVVITETEQMTAASGRAIYELLIDNATHGTANFIVNVERRPSDDAEFSDSDLSLLQEAINSAAEIEDLLDGQDVPTVITPIISDWLDENITNPSNPPIDTSLTVAGAAADAKKTGDEITDLKSALGTKIGFTNSVDVSYINQIDIAGVSYNSAELAITRRWFFNLVIPKNVHIDTISCKAKPTVNARTVYFEVWEKTGDTLSKVKSVTLNTQEQVAITDPKIYTATIDYTTEKDCMIAILSPSYGFGYYVNYGDTSNRMLPSSNVDPDANTVSYATLGTAWYMDVVATIYAVANKEVNIRLVGNGMDYEEIQDALNDINDDSATNPYTLLLMPKGTPYKPFSMLRNAWTDTYPWSNIAPRYISIIGIDKAHCIIRSDSGNYKKPCGELMTNGIIKNLTFIMTNDEQDPSATQGGYCLHIDCRTKDDVGYDMTIEDCEFEDSSAPCLGIGMHKNCELTLRRCNLHTTLAANYNPHEGYTNLVNYGVLFCHTSTLADSTDQYINVEDCTGVCDEGNKSIWIASAGDYDPSTASFYYKLLRNVFWNKTQNTPSYNISNNLTADPMNFGNNN